MPFYYDPGQGNLLIEWANQAGTTITPAGTIYRSDVQSLPFTGAVGFSLDPPHSAVFQLDTNVVWELTFSSVPEPSSLTLSTVALFGLVCRLCARQRIVKNESNDHAFRNRMSA